MKTRAFLALDLGASNGRAVLGTVSDHGKLQLEEIYRFSNGYSRINGGLYWDYVYIYNQILAALQMCRRRGIELSCIGIDAWSEDYALLDRYGHILSLPRCYRDPIINQCSEELDAQLGDPYEFYRCCGQVKNQISTLRQLYYDCTRQPELIASASKFLFIPYLFVYMLTGQIAYDATLPAIGELGDTETRGIRAETVGLLGISDLVPPRFQSGTILGYTNHSVLEATGYANVPVACIDAHDTSSAVLAISNEEDFMYVSSGTWSMYGAAVDEMHLDARAFEANLCNSPMGDGRISLMAGTAGMFVIQQCMRQWRTEGNGITYDQLTDYALKHHTDACFCFSDIPNDAHNMPDAVRNAVEKAGFQPPEDPYSLYEIFCNALAQITVTDLSKMEHAIGRRFDEIYVVGGGSQAQAVNQRLAQKSGKRICTGMTEAAVVGNILAQMVATGMVHDFAEARAVVRQSFSMKTFE